MWILLFNFDRIDTMANVDKYSFLKMVAPKSYVAGLGRGASGFTTRSDIGPAREAEEAAPAEKDGRGEELEADPEQFQDPDNETGLFAGALFPSAPPLFTLAAPAERWLMRWTTQEWCTRRTTKRRTGFTKRSMRKWTKSAE